VRLTINGDARELPAGATVAQAVAALGVPVEERGVAVAVDAEVVPRGRWSDTLLAEGARLEVVRAAAGG